MSVRWNWGIETLCQKTADTYLWVLLWKQDFSESLIAPCVSPRIFYDHELFACGLVESVPHCGDCMADIRATVRGFNDSWFIVSKERFVRVYRNTNWAFCESCFQLRYIFRSNHLLFFSLNSGKRRVKKTLVLLQHLIWVVSVLHQRINSGIFKC